MSSTYFRLPLHVAFSSRHDLFPPGFAIPFCSTPFLPEIVSIYHKIPSKLRTAPLTLWSYYCFFGAFPALTP